MAETKREEIYLLHFMKRYRLYCIPQAPVMSFIRGLPFSTYALRGGRGVKDIAEFCV